MYFTIYLKNKHDTERPLFVKGLIAKKFFSRLKGLLGKKRLDSDESLIIEPCNNIHTIGMKFPIDIIFVDKNRVVTRLVENLKPYRNSSHSNAKAVVETAAGMIARHNIKVGDQLRW